MSPQAQETLEQKKRATFDPLKSNVATSGVHSVFDKGNFFSNKYSHKLLRAPFSFAVYGKCQRDSICFYCTPAPVCQSQRRRFDRAKKSAHDTALRLGFSLCMQSFTKAIVCATAPHFSRFGPSSFLRRNRPRKGSFEKGTLCRFVQARTSGLGPCL